ncbi:MAG TPA: hypothetical protein VK447_13745 [Myxococcaceae bacterium]|nr:hypothetical protein [Myxococcaceae bacterium]
MVRRICSKQGIATALVLALGVMPFPAWGILNELRGIHELRQGPVSLPLPKSRRQQPVALPPAGLSADRTLAAPQALTGPARYQARILVLSADGNESVLPAIRESLEYLGIPYTLWIATQRPGQLTADKLSRDNLALYQGVMLTTASLGYESGNNWVSALSAAEWNALWSFEATFGVRQVTWYTYPTADTGHAGTPSEMDTTHTPLNATLTAAGREVFPYLNAANPVQFRHAWCYRAQAVATGTTALLVDGANNAIALARRFPDGRETLAVTCDGAQYLRASAELGYGLANWVTRGLFVGYRRVYVSAQVDDYFIEDDLYTGGVYRMNGTDVDRTAAWQAAFRATALGANFRLDMVFNGEGAEPDYWNNDTLIPATLRHQASFKWISHTYTHLNLNAASYAETYGELAQNVDTATRLRLTNFARDSLVCPEISGLYNPEAMNAAKDIGIRYVVSDTSQPGQDNPQPNVGIYNGVQPLILMLPRRPNNLFYNVSTPGQWRAEYNAFYRGYWGRDLTYAEILDKESDVLLMYLLKGENDPWMFHQTNLRAYDGTRSLLSDLLDRTMTKYRARYNLPWVSPTMSELGAEVAMRTKLVSAGVNVIYGDGSITLTAERDVTVPVTGLRTQNASLYGGQYTSFVPVRAGQSVTLPLQ